MTHWQTNLGGIVYARRCDRWYPAHVVSKRQNFAFLRWLDLEGEALNGGHAKYEDLRMEDPNIRKPATFCARNKPER
jgi:hypothetical protein